MEKLQISPNLCTRLRYPLSKCQKCLSACPADAIQIKEDSLRINSNCTGCEFCVPVCPNEVFTVPVKATEGEEIKDDFECICCSQLLRNEVDTSRPLPPGVVPCIGSLTVSFILEWLLEKKSPLEVVTGACGQCDLKTGLLIFKETETQIKAILDSLKMSLSPVITQEGTDQDGVDARDRYLAHEKEREEKARLSRREFFRNIPGVLVPAEKINRAGKAKRTDPLHAEKKVPERLSRIIAFLRENREALGEGTKLSIYSKIEIDDSCTGCGACTTLCPTGALSLKKTEKTVGFSWTPAHCSQCDLCKEACPSHSIQFTPGVEVQRIVDESSTALRSFHRNLCSECNQEYWAPEPEVPCPYCEKQQSVKEAFSRAIYGEYE